MHIRSLQDLGAGDIAIAGGKAANLGVLLRGGMPVPAGFCVLTGAYRAFLEAHSLQPQIDRLLGGIDPAGPMDALEQASATIRALFDAHAMPQPIADEIRAAYLALEPEGATPASAGAAPAFAGGAAPVAVRSSATAEDLPDLSFAGQQDTYLNIIGAEPLLHAVADCWASLWTARAILYRMHNEIPAEGLALAVVVQRMIPSEVSGVLFTANPLTGSRRETVIDAAYGLGEALVSGKVEPDHYVVRPDEGAILSKTLGRKALRILPREGGGTETREADARGGQALFSLASFASPGQAQGQTNEQALTNIEIVRLARLGARARTLFADPQDIEWALAAGELYLLQSRPITSLFPVPAGTVNGPLKVFFSFGAVQGMLDPITTLGRDSMMDMFATGAGLFGIHVTAETQTALHEAGERLWANFTSVLSNPSGTRIVPYVLSMVEPSIGQAVVQIREEPEFKPRGGGIRPGTILRLLRFLLPMGFNLSLNMLFPRRRREYIVANGERILAMMEKVCGKIAGSPREKLAQRTDLLGDVAFARLPDTLILFVSGVAAGIISWNALNRIARKAMADPAAQAELQDLILQVTRGMPYNPTTEMDLALWETARTIRADEASRQAFARASAEELRASYRAGSLPAVAAGAVERFLQKYGGRGLGEIDMGRIRWAEDPTHVFEMLINFLQIVDASKAPDAVFARGADSAQEAIDKLALAVRRTRGGWEKARLVRFFAGRARQLMGLRENPKFFAVRMMYTIRRELLRSGAEFAAAGELDRADDLFHLRMAEIRAFAAGDTRDWRGLIAERRRAYARELLRKQIPRLLLSDGRAFYEGLTSADDSAERITGSPVSPGRAEGKVHVVLDPRTAKLQPGEILVCPGTDPSWTPLFLSAGALVMEVGGMMTHGSVVAREYGIPAVVGVHNATTRLKTGQRVRVDGSRGIVEILADLPAG
jgi:rifampicin phosphotransferase